MPINAVRKVLNSMREHNRRTVLLPATIKVGQFDFDCTAFDISLGGVRLKVDLPIEKGTNVLIRLKNKLIRAARVVWSANGFIGLCFVDEPDNVKVGLGNLANGLT